MVEKVIFQFTAAENETTNIEPSPDIAEPISKIEAHSYEIKISEDTKLTVSFDHTIRYVSKRDDRDLAQIFEQAKKDIRKHLQTSLIHFDLQLIFDGESSIIRQNLEQEIKDIAREESLGKYTTTNLSTGSTMVSFPVSSQSIVV